MQLDPHAMKQESVYKLLIGCVVLRPIAWASTLGPDGVNNLQMKRPSDSCAG